MTSFKLLTASICIFYCSAPMIANEPANPNQSESNDRYQQLRHERYLRATREQLMQELSQSIPATAFHAVLNNLVVYEKNIAQESNETTALR